MKLSADQLDTLKELANIGIGRAAATLNSMLDAHIELSVPDVHPVSFKELDSALEHLGNEILSMIELDFSGDFDGSASLIFPPESAAKLAQVVTAATFDSDSVNSMQREILNEIGNIILNAVMGSFSNMVDQHLHYTLPNYSETGTLELSNKIKTRKNIFLLLVNAPFIVKQLNIEGQILLLFEMESFKKMIGSFDVGT